MILHWSTNNDRCLLTQLENKLSHVETHENVYESYSHLLNLSAEQTKRIFNYGCTMLWTIAIVRIFMYYF